MFHGDIDPLKPSREGYYYAYRAIRLERRYAHQCIKIAMQFSAADPEIFGAEPDLLTIDIGHRTKASCSPELYRAVLSAMLCARFPSALSTAERLSIKRKHKRR